MDCSDPGIVRRRRGRGFEYFGVDLRKIDDSEVLDRVRSLAIPPAWEDVWICPHPNGHLQAVGTDDAGRRQYLYHDRWRERRDQEKFDRMLAFAGSLPQLRRRVARDLRLERMPRDRVLAGAVRLLDLGFFRMGSEEYAEENGSFGLATIRKNHVRVTDSAAEFDYTSKGGARRVLTVTDAELLPILRTLRRRRGGGAELLAYRDDRTWVDVRSTDVNGYIQDRTGGAYTAKDFRTWSGSLLAAAGPARGGRLLPPGPRPADQRGDPRRGRVPGEHPGRVQGLLCGSSTDRPVPSGRDDPPDPGGGDHRPGGSRHASRGGRGSDDRPDRGPAGARSRRLIRAARKDIRRNPFAPGRRRV